MRSGTLAVQEERYKFHDEHVFDFLALKAFRLSQELSSDVDKFSLIRKVIPMKSTAKKQTVYYHITQFGNAANIMKTGLLRGSQISFKERGVHLNAGVVSRGYYVSLARSLVSEYIVDNMGRGGETFCVLMIDTERIRGRFKLEPVNFYGNYKYNKRAQSSEYEERLIFDSKELDVSNAIVVS